MSVALLTAQELLGLFELDGAGKVLYYRIDSGGDPGRPSRDMAGRNFYNEVVPFDNVEEFRQCVTEFTRGTKSADSFDFDCHYKSATSPVRVLLARIRERLNLNNTKSVLVHIRRGGTTHKKTQNFRGDDDERDVDQ